MKLKIKIDFTYVKLFVVSILGITTFVLFSVAGLIKAFLMECLVDTTITVTILLALIIFFGYVFYILEIFKDIKETCPIKILRVM